MSTAPFQPTPPTRTSTSSSTLSQNMSPTTTTSQTALHRSSTTSPVEQSFFSALTSKIRGRSRSRSPMAGQRLQSPEQLPPTTAQTMTTARPSQPRHFSSGSRTSAKEVVVEQGGHPHSHSHSPTSHHHHHHRHQHSYSSTSSTQRGSYAPSGGRPSLQQKRNSTGSGDMWYGRHSNDWLFNGFSVTESAKGMFNGKKS